MALSLGDVIVKLKGDGSDFDRTLDKSGRNLNSFGNKASRLGGTIKKGLKIAAVGVAAAGTAAVAFGVSSVKSFTESQDAIAQLNAVLKSTKSVAGVTSKSAQELAGSLQEVTKYSDEEVLSAESLLLTFTKIGKDTFPQATKTVLDMSTALGQDTKASAIQLGKALQDPILGVTALRRVGVNFSADQREVIKKLVETGQSAKAQKLILKELNTEFGGSAEAAGRTFAGKLKILGNQFDEVKEKIGGFIANGLIKFSEAARSFMSGPGGDGLKNSINNVKNALKGVYDFLMIYYKAAWDVIRNNSGVIKKAFLDLYTAIKTQLIPALKDLWRQVGPILGPALKTLGTAAGVTLLLAIVALAKSIEWGVRAFSAFTKAQLKLYDAVGKVTGPLWRFQVVVYNAVIGPIKQAIKWISKLINAFDNVTQPIRNALSGVENAITAPFRRAFGYIIGAIDAVLQKLNILNATKIPTIGKTVLKAVAGARASGGPVNAGMTYLTGERGRELFVPDTNGTVIPNNLTEKLLSGMGAGSINTNINGPININSPQDVDYLFKRIDRTQQLAGMGMSKP